MKKILAFLLTVVSLFLNFLSAEIIESSHFEDILNHIADETLFLIDIDDTLIIPQQTLGSDIWFQYRLKQYLNTCPNYAEALNNALGDWEAIRHLTKMKLLEDATPNTLLNLQEKAPVIALTTQGLALATRTELQLKELGVNFTINPPSKEDHYFDNGHGVLYRNGMLFTSGTHKGRAILKLLSLIGYCPKKIVFINDKLTHLREIEEALKATNINFIGLRYSVSDDRVNSFDPEIAEIQWNHSSFAHILSDKEADALRPFKANQP